MNQPSLLDKHEALARAAQAGDLNEVQILVKQGADIHAYKERALYLASYHGKGSVVKFLLERGCDPTLNDGQILCETAGTGHWECVKMLLDHGALANSQHNRSIIEATSNNHLDTVRLLLEWSIDPGADEIALRRASFGGHLAMVEFLVGKHPLSKSLNNALVVASGAGHLELVEFFLNQGADINTKKGSPLEIACLHGRLAVVQRLLQGGADISLSKRHLVRFAIINGNLALVQFLVGLGLPIPSSANLQELKVSSDIRQWLDHVQRSREELRFLKYGAIRARVLKVLIRVRVLPENVGCKSNPASHPMTSSRRL